MALLCITKVRQGLKTFSNWPTYPQLYVSGELIGGLDIVKASVSYTSPKHHVLHNAISP